MLRPTQSIAYLEDREDGSPQVRDIHDSYLFSSDVLEQIHTTVMAAANADRLAAYPVIFAWCCILHQMNVSYQERTEKRDNLLMQSARDKFEAGTGTVGRPPTGRRNSAGSIFSIESSRFDIFLENATPSKDLSVVRQLAEFVTIQGKVYNVISSMASENKFPPLTGSRVNTFFLEVLQFSYPVIGYQSDPVNTLLSLLTAHQTYWDVNEWQVLRPEHDVRTAMLYNSDLLDMYLMQALAGYPYELLPFISLCRALSTASTVPDDAYQGNYTVMELLQQTPTITFVLPDTFHDYELVNEDDSMSFMCFTQDYPLISLKSSWRRKHPEDDTYCIPAGTQGRFLSSAGSNRVVKMEYAHSTLALLGRRLEINLMPEAYHSELGLLNPDEVAEIIALLATLIQVNHVKAQDSNNTNAVVHLDSGIMQDASQHIAGGKDILTVVCDTMDYYLQDELAVNDSEVVDILNSCIKFLDAVLPEHPSRVWSYLSRNDLLSTESRAGKLTKIVGTLDLVGSKFEFLNSSVQLFHDMVEGMMTSAVQQRIGNTSATRQRQGPSPWSGVSTKVISTVISSIATASVDVFENLSTWRFQSEDYRMSLLNNTVPILTNLIKYSFGTGDLDSSNNLTSPLRPAATYVLDCFLEPSTGTLRYQPILVSFIMALTTPPVTLRPRRNEAARSQISNVLELLTSLLRVSNLLEKSSVIMEKYLFKISTLLARLCATSDEYLAPITVLLDALVFNAGISSTEPLSLLGYLGPQTSKSFLQVLSSLGKPFALSQEARCIWKLFSSILRNRQQWMSNCLLTGKTPREVMKKDPGTKSELAPHSMFSIALRKLSKLKDLDAEQALAILDFVASAQNYWPWTIFTLQKDTAYLDGLQAYVRDLKPSHLTARTSTTKAAVEARIAAYIGETFAMQLYHSRHLGNADALANKLVSGLDYYLRDGVEVAAYNKSLHNNFAKNFSNKYSGCSLDDFQRTLLQPRHLGVGFYYDLDLANRMLSFDPGWLGRKDNGFKVEMERANANLSLVDAQIVWCP